MKQNLLDHLIQSTAMLNAAIRIMRGEDERRHAKVIELWSEQVKSNMALIAHVENDLRLADVIPD